MATHKLSVDVVLRSVVNSTEVELDLLTTPICWDLDIALIPYTVDEIGVTDTREMIADLKKTFLTSAKEIILAVDHTKFDQISFVNLCGFDQINTVVTDVEPSEAWKNFFAEKQIRLIY